MNRARAIRYLTVPSQAAPALLIVIFGALLALATKASLLGIPLALLLITGFFNYANLLLDRLADGIAEPPVLSIEMMNPVGSSRTLMMLFCAGIAFFLSGAASWWLGAVPAVLVALLFASVLPAMIAVQAVTGSAAQALNVGINVRLMQRLGTDYLLIAACFVLAGALGSSVVAADGLPLIVRLAFVMYLWLALFCLVGGVLHERRDDLGLDQIPEEIDDATTDATLERSRTRQVDLIYASWRGGAYQNAWKIITTQLEQSTDPLAELRWLYERIARWPDPRLANRLAGELLPRLLALKHTGEALDIARARLATDADFRPGSSNDLLTLARLARDAGDRPTARALLRDFTRFYPNDRSQPAADVLAGQLER
ncbi:MAG TPA: hypothetical protein VNQ81_10200 [Povalibacter sp.]|nr:hypothetical protein [Povalibacter sp.]